MVITAALQTKLAWFRYHHEIGHKCHVKHECDEVPARGKI